MREPFKTTRVLRLPPGPYPTIDWRRSKFHALPGRAVVEMLPQAQKSGQIWLPDSEGGRLDCDLGVVLSATLIPVVEGDLVLVDPLFGKHMTVQDVDGWTPEGEIRIFGCAASTDGKAVRVPWDAGMVARMDGEGALRPYGRRLIIDRGKTFDRTESGLYLPDSQTYRPTIGTVVRVGPEVADVEPGARVVYMATLATTVDGLEKNHCIVHEDAVLCEVY